MALPSEVNPHLKRYDHEKLNEAFMRIEKTADDFLFGMMHGEKRRQIALNFMGVRTTYEELDTNIEKLARSLFGFGIRQGDFVSIAMPNMTQTVEYIYACWRIGAVTNLIDPRTNGEGILERIKRTNSKLFVTVMDICDPLIDDIVKDIPCEHVVVVSPSDSLKPCFHIKPLLGILLYKSKMKKFAEGHMGPGSKYIFHRDFLTKYYSVQGDIRAVYKPEMLAAVLYTSGTASDGIIKGAMITHRAYNASPCAFKQQVQSDEYQRRRSFGGFIPFFFAYGSMTGLHASLCGELELKMIPIFDPNKFADMLLKLKPNIFLGVPRFHEQLANHPKLQKKSNKLSFVSIAISGGDKISVATLEKVNATYKRNGSNIGLRVGYGATELGGSICVMPYYDPDGSDFNWREEGNVGYLMPHCKGMVIVPETGEELPFGEDGELCMNSLSQMEGYYGMPEITEEITVYGKDGTKYYRMGDKGHLDESGCFHFVDRYKRSMMRPDGHTVHPSPIENVIMAHEAVHLCAVAGLHQKGSTSGVIPSAFVVLHEEYKDPAKRKEVLQSIDELCLKRLPARDRAIAYKAVDELPYTPMGKVFFRELEKETFEPENFLVTDLAFFPELQKK